MSYDICLAFKSKGFDSIGGQSIYDFNLASPSQMALGTLTRYYF
jgi:hypothetical protein